VRCHATWRYDAACTATAGSFPATRVACLNATLPRLPNRLPAVIPALPTLDTQRHYTYRVSQVPLATAPYHPPHLTTTPALHRTHLHCAPPPRLPATQLPAVCVAYLPAYTYLCRLYLRTAYADARRIYGYRRLRFALPVDGLPTRPTTVSTCRITCPPAPTLPVPSLPPSPCLTCPTRTFGSRTPTLPLPPCPYSRLPALRTVLCPLPCLPHPV